MAAVLVPKGANVAQEKAVFLGTAIEKSIKIPGQAYASGALLRFQIPNVGIAKKFRVLFNVSLTSGATAPTGVSGKSPFNLFTNVTYKDYAGITRVNASAWSLSLLEIVKRFGWDFSFSAIAEPYASNVWSNTITSLVGWFDVPVAPSDMDPTGSLNLEVANGQTFLEVQCNPNLVATPSQNDDVPLYGPAGASSTINAGSTVSVVYYFWEPVTVGGRLIRPDSVLYPYQIHELLGFTDSSGIAANQPKVTTLRTGREYHRVIHSLMNNARLDTVDVSEITFLYNGNLPTMDEPLQAYLSRIRDTIYRDLPVGTFYFNLTKRPWDSTSYGQLQTVLQMASGAAFTNPYLETLTEGFYTPQ